MQVCGEKAERASLGGIAGKLLIRQPYSIDFHLIGANRGRRLKPLGSGIGYVVVLVYTVATHSESSHQHAILVERQAAGKEDHSILVGIRRLRTLGARVSHIERKQVEEWSRTRTINAGCKEGLSTEADGSIGDCGASRERQANLEFLPDC